MKVCVVIVHHWNPEGGGRHQSLRPDPAPKINALQSQLLSLCRLGVSQALLHLGNKAVYLANENFVHEIDIKIVTDGSNHVLDFLDPALSTAYEHITVSPVNSFYLGFEAQKIIGEQASLGHDLYCYLEDDLVIHDSLFFRKIKWFTEIMGDHVCLLPQRYENGKAHDTFKKLYIDGPLPPDEVLRLIPQPSPVRLVDWSGARVAFESPSNPHSGCFVLTGNQINRWKKHETWGSLDASFISPLESAATLGISKNFEIFKPCFTHASWLEIQHHGDSFISLLR